MRGKYRWPIALGALVAYGLATWLPVPGVDYEALRAVSGASGQSGLLGLFNQGAPLVSPFGSMLLLLVVLRGIGRVIAPDPATRRAPAEIVLFVLFLIVATVRAYAIAVTLESLESFGGVVVQTPGFAFRAIVAASYVAAAAITWALATFVTRTGVAQGPLFLFAGSLIVDQLADGYTIGSSLVNGDRGPGALVLHLAFLVPAIVVLAGLSRRAPETWPVPLVRGVALTSPMDALVFPYLSGLALTGLVWLAPFLLLVPGQAVFPYLGVALSTGLAVAIVVWLGKKAPSRPQPGHRLAAVLLPIASIASVAVGLLLMGLTSGHGFSRLVAPSGPFAGDRRFHVEVMSPVGAAARDAPIVLRRLEELGVDAQARAVGRDRIVLELDDVGDAQAALSTVLRPNVLAFRLVAIDQGALAPSPEESAPDGVTIEDHYAGDTTVRVFRARSREALAPILARPGVVASEVAIECDRSADDGAGARCTAWRLEPASLGSRDVADAEVAFDPQTSAPYVSLRFTDDGARRFEALTRASVGRRLAICIDDHIESAPIIRDAITGGRASITLGGNAPAATLTREAQGLVVALRSGSLEGRWQIEALTERP